MLLAVDGPVLLAVIPSTGVVIEEGTTLGVAPQQLLLRFDSAIDPDSLDGSILFKRGGDKILGNGNDVDVHPGYIGISDNSFDVVVRFDQNLPDDLYQMTIVGSGDNPLLDTTGKAFKGGTDLARKFSLDLGAQVVAVVPQPIKRDATTGKLLPQMVNTIEVYFNANDPLNVASAQTTDFYQLIRTQGTETPLDDVAFKPTSVTYSAATGKAVLTFQTDVLMQTNTYRLRIGTKEPLASPVVQLTANNAGTDFAHAAPLGPNANPFPNALGTQTVEVSDTITSVATGVVFPGSPEEPGERDPEIEARVAGFSNNSDLPILQYNFQSVYGTVLGQPVQNNITPAQKERVREVFSYYADFLGVQIVETPNSGMTIATGDVRVLAPNGPPSGIGGIAETGNYFSGRAIMNVLYDWGASERGGSYFQTAMHEIGHLLGLGHNYAAPALTVQGNSAESSLGTSLTAGEPVFPGDLDLIYAKYLWPALGNDINVYRFSLANAGRLNVETFAERLASEGLAAAPSHLDTVISLYNASGKLVARNDDYYGTDSFVQLDLAAGTYYVAITSQGNTNFDPTVPNSGFGGTSQGNYKLRLSFTPTVTAANDGLRDATGTLLDGDRDGRAGGVANFWFKVDLAHTIIVDKAATGGTGTLGSHTNPYTRIANALAVATPGSIVRIVGNGGADKNLATLDDNLSYNIGFDAIPESNPAALSDGSTFNVPRGVTVMIDAGTVIKLRAANINVGTFAQGVDRSGGALQVLGTPAKDAQGNDIGSVIFTSFYNPNIGDDPTAGILAKGNWGGIVFRNDSDNESAGVFLNYVNQAKLSYGGGKVSVNSVSSAYAPIHVETARPTITYNLITQSADSAVSADPNSFEENEFLGPGFQADYTRVGPRVYGNTLQQNSINALFIRIRTLNNQPLDTLTVNARLANTDIVHVLNEVLLINGEPGGFIEQNGQVIARPSARLAVDPGTVLKMSGARIETEIGAQFIAEGTLGRPIIFTSLFDDRYGGSGTSDTTNNQSSTTPSRGSWSGMYFGPLSIASLDHTFVGYAGGPSGTQGGFDNFDPIEINQAQVRITNSMFDENLANGGGERDGRSPSEGAVIFIRGAQPVVLNNTIKNSNGAAMSINVNALNSKRVDDWGRSRGNIDLQGSFPKNTGPLIDNNLIGNNGLNGMHVRGGTITTNVIWDDTDIVHIVTSSIQAPNQQSLSGTLRLQSSASESLVVKVLGTNTDLIASGSQLDTTDRIGGTLQIVGTPNHPVVITSLKDDTVGAGLTPEGFPQKDTLNRKGVVEPAPQAKPESGPILLDAAARDVHGSSFGGADGWDMLEREVNYIYQNSKKPVGRETNILYIGWHDPRPNTDDSIPYSREAIDWVAGRLGLTVDYVGNNLSAVLGVNFNNYAMVYIPSHFDYPLPEFRDDPYEDTNWWGGISDAMLNVLIENRKGALLNYINSGGGLLVMAQDSAARPYQFLATNDPFILRKSGGNVLTATAQAPTEWWSDYGISDEWLNVGTPYRAAFKGTTGFNRLEPWAVDPVTGEIGMLGLRAGDVGLGKPWDVVAPADWGSIRLDALSNDRNVEIVNETERSFTAAGDTNQLPSTAQYLGQLAKDHLSGDENVRLGFEINGGLSQAASSPGGADVDVYSFTGTAGTTVWFDIDKTASSLDSIVELVDSNGAVIARSDNSLAESQGTQALVGIAKRLQAGELPGIPSQFSTPDFYSTNPKDAGMRLILPGEKGSLNTYFVRVRSGSANLSNLTGGLTRGAYVLQIRLQEVDEFAGSTVRYSDIRYATNGIEVIGKPEDSPLVSNTSETNLGDFGISTPSSFATAQDLGNPLESDGLTKTVSGNLETSTEVDWYRFDLSYEQIQSISGFSDGLGTFAAMLRINYADGLVRPDTTLSLFDSSGTLLLVARDSQVVDAMARPNTGSDPTNLNHGSYGSLDPTLGPVQLPAGSPGNSQTYYVAVSSSGTMPEAISAIYTGNTSSNPLVRLEPVDGIERISEDHFFFGGYPAGVATFDTPDLLFPAATSGQLNDYADPYQLGDVVLFVNTVSGNTTRLRKANAYTGAALDSSGTAPALQQPVGNQQYYDIAMRNDGRIFSLSRGNNADANGNFVEFNTGSGAIVNEVTDDMLDTYRFTPQTTADPTGPDNIGTQDEDRGLNYEAMAFMQNELNTTRRLFAIGNRGPGIGGDGTVTETTNLLFELDPDTGEVLNGGTLYNGAAQEIPDVKSLTTAVPIGNFPGLNGIVTGLAVLDGRIFMITDRGDLYDVESGVPAPGGQAQDNAMASGSLAQISLPANTTIRGLAAGPLHVENGAYAHTLFAIDSRGNIYALEASVPTSGVPTVTPAPVFLDGRTSIATGISGAQGLAFSTLDYNLWHTTITRSNDLGHGLNESFDHNFDLKSSTIPNQFEVGGASIYFGLEGVPPGNPFINIAEQPGVRPYASNPDLYNTYGLPGGAQGAFTSNTFSLEGYTAGDQPVLYFNYFLDTPDTNSTGNAARDVIRVKISNDGVNWREAATSNVVLGSGGAEQARFPSESGGAYRGYIEKQHVQGLFESDRMVGTPPTEVFFWQQARVDLGDFAGQKNLRLRFEFSTSGSMGSGNPFLGTGAQLAALPGNELRDGQSFKIDGTVFTFRSGFALNVPAGGGVVIKDGETFTINGTTYEFNKTGGVAGGNVRIDFSNQSTAAEIAQAIGTALQPLFPTRKVFGTRIEVPTATTVTQSADPALVVQGAALPTGSNIRATDIFINGNMSAGAVANAIADALDRVFTVGFSLDVTTDGASIADGATFTVNGRTYEFEKTGGVTGGNIAISIDDSMTANEVELAVVSVLSNLLPNTQRPGGSVLIRDALSASSATAAVVVSQAGIDNPNLHTSSKVSRDILRIFGHTINASGPLASYSGVQIGDSYGSYTNPSRDRHVAALAGTMITDVEGIYIDDIVIGFASRGEMVTNALPGDTLFASLPIDSAVPTTIRSGLYQLQIGPTDEYALPSFSSAGDIFLTKTFNVNDRFATGLTLIAPPATSIVDGQTFTIDDGVAPRTFEFDTNGSVTSGNLRIAVPRRGSTVRASGEIGDGAFGATSGDYDFYSLTDVAAGDVITVDVDALALGSTLDSIVGIYNSAGTLMAFNNNQTPNNPDSFLSFIAPADDEYFVVVGAAGSGLPADAFDPGSGGGAASTGIYEVLIGLNSVAAPLAFLFPREEDGSITTATPTDLVAIPATAADVAVAMRDAINNAVANQGFGVRASTTVSPSGATTGNRVDLFDAYQVVGDVQVLRWGVENGNTVTGQGDISPGFAQGTFRRAPGQTVIFSNSVSDSRQVGIQVIPKIGQIAETGVAFTQLSYFDVGTPGDNGGIANLPTYNTKGWVPGISIKNNLVVATGRTGIQVGGDPNASYTYAQRESATANRLRPNELFLPFVQVVNNTVYEAPNGIAASNASSPTIVNNVIAKTGVFAADNIVNRIRGAAINVDGASGNPKSVPAGLTIRFGETIVSANLYQDNVYNLEGTSSTSDLTLPTGAPLFVDADNRNFNLKEGSIAIDSAIDTVQERGALLSATAPLGIPPKPIQAPETDLLGQLRIDDPDVDTPTGVGIGGNVFKDRGALERADFLGPIAQLVNPEDNDSEGIDRNPANNQLVLVNALLTDFSIRLVDGIGTGIDDSSVNINQFTIQRTVAGVTATLQPGTDYALAYDTNSKTARLIPAQGLWINGTYKITLNNSEADGIRDLADNVLQPNVPPTTQFVIQLTDQITSSWQNPRNRFDVSDNGQVSGFDVLQIVNYLLANGPGQLPLVANAPPYLDVSGDGRVSSLDVLQVVGFILANQRSRSAAPQAATTSTDGAGAPAVSPAARPATAESDNSLAVSVAISSSADAADSEDALQPATEAHPLLASPARKVAVAARPMADTAPAGALAATMEPEELDLLDNELDSILTDLTGDL